MSEPLIGVQPVLPPKEVSVKDLLAAAQKEVKARIHDHTGDQVFWTAHNAATKEEKGEWVYNACYGPINTSYHLYEILCRAFPRAIPTYPIPEGSSYKKEVEKLEVKKRKIKGDRLTQKDFFKLIRLGKEVGLVLPKAEARSTSEHGHELFIPAYPKLRQVDSFLTAGFFRFLDSYPREAALALRLQERVPEAPFLACILLASSRRSMSHNYLISGQQEVVPWGKVFGWALYLTTPLEERAKLPHINGWSPAYEMVYQIAHKALGVTQKAGAYGQIGDALLAKTLPPAQLLHPYIWPLLRNPQDFADAKKFKEFTDQAPWKVLPEAKKVEPVAMKVGE